MQITNHYNPKKAFDLAILIPFLEIIKNALTEYFDYPLIYLSPFVHEKHRLFIWVKYKPNVKNGVRQKLKLHDAITNLLKLNDSVLTISEYEGIDEYYQTSIDNHYVLPLYNTSMEYQQNWLSSKTFRWNQRKTKIHWPPDQPSSEIVSILASNNKLDDRLSTLVEFLSEFKSLIQKYNFSMVFIYFSSNSSNCNKLNLLLKHHTDKIKFISPRPRTKVRQEIHQHPKLCSVFNNIKKLSSFYSSFFDDSNSLSIFREDESFVKTWLLDPKARNRFCRLFKGRNNETYRLCDIQKC